jgi:hypothetical protein
MLDVEIAKEMFHSRLKAIDKALLGGADPFVLFKNMSSRIPAITLPEKLSR